MILSFFFGLAALVAGAEMLVRGASRLAVSMGVSSLVVGLTVVSFGTSAPELAVSVRSAWSGQVDIALGNVVGSNLFNVLVILGLSAVITPLVVHRQIIRQEVPIMIGASLMLWLMALDGGISRWEGVVLAVLSVGYTVLLIRQSRRANSTQPADVGTGSQSTDDRSATQGHTHWGMQVLLILAGLVLLVAGAHWLVAAAVVFAEYLGVSELIIGLTIVAAGTSLPEVATSVVAALRGEKDIAVGNVVGSNIFNILVVVGLSASVAPVDLAVAPKMLDFDLPVMVAVAIACLPVFFVGARISLWEGMLFLSLYAAYLVYLVLDATSHAAFAGYATLMGACILPLIAVGLLSSTWWHWRGARGRQRP